MRIRTLAALLALVLAGCTTSESGRSEPDAIAFAGTPPLLAFKLGFCVGSFVLAGPIVAMSSITRPWPPVPVFYNGGDAQSDLRQGLNDDINANCGPPYYVSPAPATYPN
jgi:hypothetical protein